jgi:hypothetical protein
MEKRRNKDSAKLCHRKKYFVHHNWRKILRQSSPAYKWDYCASVTRSDIHHYAAEAQTENTAVSLIRD